MGRSAQRSSDGPDPRRGIDAASLDEEAASILTGIEQEMIPPRLLHLASAMQDALQSMCRRNRPN
jgi:hypothetical protein